MSQKINPISFRLGVSQFCKFSLQKYGRSFLIYSNILYKNFYIYDYLYLLLKVKNLNFDVVEMKFKEKKVIIYLDYFSDEYAQKLDVLELKRSLGKVFSFWFKTPMFVSLYKESNYINSSNLIANYVFYSLSYRNRFGNILDNIYKILILYLDKKKVVFAKTGLLSLYLKGFKFVLTGCFDNSRTQMSKTIKYSFGSLCLTKLNNYVEYSFKEIHTEYGICGFQVWLIFENK